MMSDVEDYCSDFDAIEAIQNGSDNSECTSRSYHSCRVITKESLLEAQKEDVYRVMELLMLNEQNARKLLICHRWDVEKLLAVFVEKGKERLFAEAGVAVGEHQQVTFPDSCEVLCGICIENIPSEATIAMDCGHCFCNNCWTEHFVVKINEGQSKRIRCMAFDCNAICDEVVIQNLVSAKNPHLAQRFEKSLLESYIEDNKKVKWCPSVPHCGNAIQIKGDVYFEVECTCGLQFCFSCLEEAHSPCSCLMWQLWTKKCLDESETVNWIKVNTKPCPKCLKLVEKNGGCNQVTCICGQSFCWLCGEATVRDHNWAGIVGHSCGRYREDQLEEIKHAKRELYRYIHYCNRFEAHIDSLKKELKLKKIVLDKISISEGENLGNKNFRWITNGVFLLFRSRQILSYSYPFAFYMFGSELFRDEMTKKERELKQNLFEDQQQQLEAHIEKLSMCIAEAFHEFSLEQVFKIRMQVINLSVVIDKLCCRMYECIENDLLGSLQHSIHNIAPYNSKGIKRACELPVSCDSNMNLKTPMASGNQRQIQINSGKNSTEAADDCCLSSDDNLQSSESEDDDHISWFGRSKRIRKECIREIDLNMPAAYKRDN